MLPKKVSYLSQRSIASDSIKQRAHAAVHYVRLLSQGKILVNIDESSIQFSKQNEKAWGPKFQQLFCTDSKRYQQIGLIAALCSDGRVYFQLFKGKNNSVGVYFFILQLIQALERLNHNWRENHVLMLDNASYHRSSYLREKLNMLKISTLFLGPYQFDLAPVEKLFAFIKKGNLQQAMKSMQDELSQINLTANQREPQVHVQLKELSQILHKNNYQWCAKLFFSRFPYVFDYLCSKY